MKNFLTNLNKEQYEAATTLYGPLFIIAGAGTGKTNTLAARVANMIDEGIEPQSILLLTFTNKAAKEMKSRIMKWVGDAGKDITACTFHSFCSMFLHRHAGILSLKNDFTILDGPDASEAMGIVSGEFFETQKKLGIEYSRKDFPDKATCLQIHSNAINNNLSIAEVANMMGYRMYVAEIKEIDKQYGIYKKERSMLDYDDLLVFTKTILEKVETIREKVGQQYQFVAADEYQDTNFLQDEILRLICKDHKNLAVVGDDNQSIYKFRGARIENILTFEKRYPNCKKIILHQNYRSSQEILDLANTVMEHAQEGIPKTLHGQFSYKRPFLILPQNEYKQNLFIIDTIEQHKQNGVPLNEMAVIVRSARQTYGLENLLNQRNIPFEKFGGLKFMEKAIVRDILAFLRLTVNKKDELALHRVLKLYPGIGTKFSSNITKEVLECGLDALKVVYLKHKFRPYLLELYSTLTDLEQRPVGEQLEFLIENYYPKTVERNIELSKMDEDKKITAQKELCSGVQDAKALYEMAKGYRRTEKFIEDIVLDSNQNSENEDKLNLTTIHSAKGLEYEVVFMMDMIDGITPRIKNEEDMDAEEQEKEEAEELRCVYVALTRAKKYLYLIAPEAYEMPMHSTFQNQFSRFINHDDIIKCMQSNASWVQINKMRKSYNTWDWFTF